VRGGWLALPGGPSTSPLDSMRWALRNLRLSRAALLLALGAAGSGCDHLDDPTVWRAQFPSPDGQWIATAITTQNGGFGSAFISTSVHLRRRDGSVADTTVLELSCPGPIAHPYVLDNSANAGGSVHLSVTWDSPMNLRIDYDSRPTITFQAAQVGPLRIAAQARSDVATGS
jgi:hypothetical protein